MQPASVSCSGRIDALTRPLSYAIPRRQSDQWSDFGATKNSLFVVCQHRRAQHVLNWRFHDC